MKLTQYQTEIEIIVQRGALIANPIVCLQLMAQLAFEVQDIGGYIQIDNHIALVLIVCRAKR